MRIQLSYYDLLRFSITRFDDMQTLLWLADTLTFKSIKNCYIFILIHKIINSHLLTRQYHKFLEISKDIQVSISEDKISEDEKWDGLKGYITNTSLDAERIVAQYHGLWVVERAFRISKGTLDMRPMFHFTERRIEAHVCICFIAYKVYKELERIIKLAGIKMSVGDVIKAARTITTIRVRLPENREILTKTLFLTERHKAIEPLFKQSTLNLE